MEEKLTPEELEEVKREERRLTTEINLSNYLNTVAIMSDLISVDGVDEDNKELANEVIRITLGYLREL